MRTPILACAALLLLPAPCALADPPPPETFEPAAPPLAETVTVSLLSFRARIVDSSGAPIADRKPEELDARVGGSKVPVGGVDYFDQPVALTETPDPEPRIHPAGAPVARASVKGQLVVFFVAAEPKPADRTPRYRVRRRPKPAVGRLLASPTTMRRSP